MVDEGDSEGHGARWPQSRDSERKAINILEGILLDIDGVQATFETDEKYPNVDGEIHLVDDERRSVGVLLSQVKKLPDDATNPAKLPGIELEKLEFAKSRHQPCLLIGVDVESRIGYWLHLSTEFYDNLDITPDQIYKTVHFPQENTIERGSNRCIQDWYELAVFGQDYPDLHKLKELWDRSNAALGDERREFVHIQRFIDTYNNLLDREFSIVKDIKYPNTWKVGYLNNEFQDSHATYAFYPILEGTNEVLIKDVDADDTRELFLEFEEVSSAHSIHPNYIKENPREQAFKVVRGDVMDLVEGKHLDHTNNPFLAKDYLFAFVDQFHELMDLPIRDSYRIDELSQGYTFLQLYVVEYLNETNNIRSAITNSYIDLRTIRGDRSIQRDKLLDRVRKIKPNTDSIEQVVVGARKFPPGLFGQAKEALRNNGVTEIERPFRLPDRPPLEEVGGRKVWEGYDADIIRDNVETLYLNVFDEYEKLFSTNFTELYEWFELLHGASRIVIIHDISDDWEPGRFSISYEYLRNAREDGVEVSIHHENDSAVVNSGLLEKEKREQFVEFDGKMYERVGGGGIVLDLLYHDYPALGYVYEDLERNIGAILDEYQSKNLYK